MSSETNKSTYEHTRAPHRFLGDVARTIDEHFFGPSTDIYYSPKNRCLYVKINLPGFSSDEITIRLVPEPKDCGPFDERAHLHVTAERQDKIDRDKFDVIMETRPLKYDFKIPLHVTIKEGEHLDGLKLDVDNGVCSIQIPHELQGIIIS